MTDSYIKAGDSVGGIVGWNNNGTVSNCSNSGTVTGTIAGAFVGGIVGWNNKGTVSSCSNSGEVTSEGDDAYVGGIVGWNSNGTVSNCSNSGEVTGEGGNAYVGGIVGYSNGTVSNCSNRGTVTGKGTGVSVGGIVGHSYSSTVSNCYYLGQDGLQGVGNESENKGATPKDEDVYTSGEVVRLLDPDGNTWGQKLDGESYPVPLGCLSEEERAACKIYNVTFTYKETPEATEGTKVKFGNSGTEITAPDVTPVDGYRFVWNMEVPIVIAGQNITVTGDFKKLSTLTIEALENGSIIVKVDGEEIESEKKVVEGAEVSLETNAAEGYELSSLTVMSEDEPIEVENNKFTMPASDVTVTATFNAIDYSVTINETANGTVKADKTMAHIGNVVTLTVSPADGYELEDLTVEADGKTITVTDNAFTMPASNVTVTATFTEIEPEPEPTPTPEPSPAPEPEPTYYRVDLRPMTGAKIIPASRVVEEGGTLTFTIEIEEGYVADSMLVTVSQGIGKAVEVKPDEEGIYTIKNVDGLVTITVYGVKEATPVGMEDIEGVQVYAHEGAIYVYTPTEKRVMIVAMNGVLKANGEQIGKRRYELPRGFYVVWVEGESFKVAN